jgi:hypothetical protein
MAPRPGLLLAGLAVAAVAGCGNDRSARTTSTSDSTAGVTLPALARTAAAPGEIVVRGEASPATHGPYAFDGRYLVRFEQYAPENPKLDFAAETAFTVMLTTRAGDPRGAIDLFQAAARRGRRELTIRGRSYVDISFGDYPYVMRFTPRSGQRGPG